MSKQALLSCENVAVRYDSDLAIEGVSFSIDEGDYLCILGENGAGKSTLMKAILGLVKLSSGQVQLNGLTQSEIGYLPQQTVVQKDFPAKVFEVVLSGRMNRHKFLPFYTKQDKIVAKDMIKTLGADTFSDKSYRELSGGQQQRVLLARALCATEKLLLLDEPANGLDPVMSTTFYRLLSDLNKKGITIIMISHDVNSAIKYGTKFLHLGVDDHSRAQFRFYDNADDYKKSDVGSKMIGGKAND